MFDFSCSPFLDENNSDFTNEERTIRVLRNNIMNHNLPGKFGGKKRKNNFTKNRRNKNKKTRRIRRR